MKKVVKTIQKTKGYIKGKADEIDCIAIIAVMYVPSTKVTRRSMDIVSCI